MFDWKFIHVLYWL
jgi:hypothetical protein